MDLRRDAGYAAARVATFVRELADDAGPPQVATVGRLSLHPNLVNVVAGTATITVDLRHTDEAALVAAERCLAAFLEDLAEAEDVTIAQRTLARFEPVTFDADIVDLVERTAEQLDQPVLRLPSGAGHDAQMLARVCPAGMVFVPSVDGISHNPAEHTEDDDLAAGTDVLLHTVLHLAGADLCHVRTPES